ncbi:MAG: Uncharacterized protein FD156_1197 [Nitrospirae bacterium]|nr:MAG: Uncharacterized protein FD156_1197 [Nitrospirota bacterium]
MTILNPAVRNSRKGSRCSVRPAHLKSAAELGAHKPHGTRMRYMAGCKCMLCRAANSSYETGRAALRRQGLVNGIISAKRAQAHLVKLSKMGIGRRAVHAASGVNKSIIRLIRKGTRTHIRKNTERRILAVTISAARPHTVISAARVWALIKKLLKSGFSKRALAMRLGYKNSLQLNENRVIAKNAVKVFRFYKLIMQGGE